MLSTNGKSTGAYGTDAQIRSNRQIWADMWGKLGWTWDATFRPSVKAVAAIGMSPPEDIVGWEGEIREEPCVATAGMLALLCVWALHRRRREEKARAHLILVAFLQALLQPNDIEGIALEELAEEHQELCQDRTEGGDCPHVVAFELAAGERVYEAFASHLSALAVQTWTCECAARTLGETLCVVATIAHGALEMVSRKNALKEPHWKLDNRLTRIGEDYRKALAATRRLGSATMEAGAAIDKELRDPSQRVRVWIGKRVQQHLASAIGSHSGAPSGVHSITEDGARLGNPGEETVIFQHWSEQIGRGHTPHLGSPPHVPRHNKMMQSSVAQRRSRAWP